jgi:serine phosphatase RsbU (regulator of sigma subunit)
VRDLGLTSALVLPLTGRDGTFGTISLFRAKSRRRYGADDLAFAEDVARRAAVAVENARIHGQQTGRLAAITRVADAAQRAILAPVPARVGSVALAAAYASAAREALVGGDLYEVVQRPGAVRLLIGDVRGKGLEAVRMATVVLGEFRAAAVDHDDLATAARRMDTRLAPHLGEEDFVTAVLAEIRDDGSCAVVCCGHPPALLARDGMVSELGCADSLPLGLGATPAPTRVSVPAGSRLLLYTDGVLEARDPSGRFVEPSRLLAPLTAGDLGTVPDRILRELRAAVGTELSDDLALLAAEYQPD